MTYRFIRFVYALFAAVGGPIVLHGWRRRDTGRFSIGVVFILAGLFGATFAEGRETARPTAGAILDVMLKRAPWVDRNVSTEERAFMLAPIATAIAEAANTPEEAAALILLGRLEGEEFALAIVRGGCTSSGCDHGASRGVFQVQRVACPDVYRFPAGSSESIRMEARCAIGLLHDNASRCREHALTPWHGAFSGYATGGRCHWSGADGRVRKAQRVLAELVRAEAAN